VRGEQRAHAHRLLPAATRQQAAQHRQHSAAKAVRKLGTGAAAATTPGWAELPRMQRPHSARPCNSPGRSTRPMSAPHVGRRSHSNTSCGLPAPTLVPPCPGIVLHCIVELLWQTHRLTTEHLYSRNRPKSAQLGAATPSPPCTASCTSTRTLHSIRHSPQARLPPLLCPP
jgi:hypothetical protein